MWVFHMLFMLPVLNMQGSSLAYCLAHLASDLPAFFAGGGHMWSWLPVFIYLFITGLAELQESMLKHQTLVDELISRPASGRVPLFPFAVQGILTMYVSLPVYSAFDLPVFGVWWIK